MPYKTSFSDLALRQRSLAQAPGNSSTLTKQERSRLDKAVELLLTRWTTLNLSSRRGDIERRGIPSPEDLIRQSKTSPSMPEQLSVFDYCEDDPLGINEKIKHNLVQIKEGSEIEEITSETSRSTNSHRTLETAPKDPSVTKPSTRSLRNVIDRRILKRSKLTKHTLQELEEVKDFEEGPKRSKRDLSELDQTLSRPEAEGVDINRTGSIEPVSASMARGQNWRKDTFRRKCRECVRSILAATSVGTQSNQRSNAPKSRCQL